MDNEKIIIEIKNLVEDVESVKENISVYCEFMKNAILNTSGLN